MLLLFSFFVVLASYLAVVFIRQASRPSLPPGPLGYPLIGNLSGKSACFRRYSDLDLNYGLLQTNVAYSIGKFSEHRNLWGMSLPLACQYLFTLTIVLYQAT